MSRFNTSRPTGPVFPKSAPSAYPLFYRTYSRPTEDSQRESWERVTRRCVEGLRKLGNLTDEQTEFLYRAQLNLHCLSSGRWLWVGGTEWSEKPENYYGCYNCSSTNLKDWDSFAIMMDLAMQGCGTGAIIIDEFINQIPTPVNQQNARVVVGIGENWEGKTLQEHTEIYVDHQANYVRIVVGDSRKGWVDSYRQLLENSSDPKFDSSAPVEVDIDLGYVRPKGQKLVGFGGVSNPAKLPEFYEKIVKLLNKPAKDKRKLTSVECCLLIDEAAIVIVAGSIRRCLPEDALVHTSTGLVPIKNVHVGDLVQTPIGFKKVINKFDQGEQEVVELQTNGTVPRATKNHKVAVLNSVMGDYIWKTVEDLKPEDRLLHTAKVLPGVSTRLPDDFTEDRPKNSRTAKPITIPELDEEVAWLIGYTHGNGYVSLGRNKKDKPYGALYWATDARYMDQATAISDRINSVLNKFNVTTKHGKLNSENTYRISVCSIRLTEYFYEHIKKPNQELEIPSFILQAQPSIRAAYLAGLFDSDGAANNRPPVLISTIYKSFARQVASVASSLGLVVRTKEQVRTEEGWNTMYHLTVPALKEVFNEQIAPYSIKGELYIGQRTHGFTIPNTMMRETYCYSEMNNMGFSGSRTIASNYQTYVQKSSLELDVPVTFKGLGSVDVVHTYDIEVEDIHCFYCDGYLTHNSAGIRQALSTDLEFAKAKDNLWQQDKDGNWFIDPDRDALRMANHTRVFMSKPTRAEVLESVTKQFYSGEGAIQYAPEAIARCNVDLLNTYEKKHSFLDIMNTKGVEAAREYLISLEPEMDDYDKEHRMQRYGLNPCAEQVSADFLCNLAEIHLNMISPRNLKAQEKAFQAGGLAVAVLLNHDFVHPRHKAARKSDPIVGVSFTGLFDHFVHKFGVPWLQWWAEGRPDTVEGRQFKEAEVESLSFWSKIAHQATWDYCDEHGLKRPNRVTSVQPAGCLDVTAVRVFDQGVLLMDELVEPGSGDTDSLPLSVRNGIPSTKAIANEPRDLVKVVLNNNRIIRMTPDHRLSIGGQWIRADEMKPGMTVDYSLNQYNKIEDISLLSINPEHYTRKYRYETKGHHRGVLSAQVETPVTVTPDLSYLIGLILGNGCFSERNYRLRITHGNINILHKAQSIIECLFGIKGSICIAEGKAPELSVPSKQLYDWFHLNRLVKGSKSKELDRIPEPIRRSSKESILACFAGIIDTDGCPRNNTFSIDCASEKFIRHLQQVGESVGLCFGVSNNTKGTNFQTEKSIWTVHLYRTYSCKESIDVLNDYSTKLHSRPVLMSNKVNSYPYEIKEVIIESGTPDYTYDITVEREKDDESWYWQGGLKSHNSKSLLTGASPGWHPPKAQRFIRRITFRKDDPVALACLDMGYSAVPSQSDKDENGRLLDSITDPRCTEWLIEIPTEVTWANLPGADEIDISKFSALAQFDFYMQVQKYYTTFNTSATIEYREHEIEPLANRIYDAIQNNEGYISAALLARFDANETFPRLPFEPIDKETYDRLAAEQESRKLYRSFKEALQAHDNRYLMLEAGPAGCDSDKCLLPMAGPPKA